MFRLVVTNNNTMRHFSSLLERATTGTTVKNSLFRFVGPVKNTNMRAVPMSTGNITYSGGQASEGQGGFYASSVRASGGEAEDYHQKQYQNRESVLAMAADVQKISTVMRELDTLEQLLSRESGDNTSGRYIELRAAVRKLMTQPDVLQALDRLVTAGEPVWGLSISERDMVIEAREKVKQC